MQLLFIIRLRSQSRTLNKFARRGRIVPEHNDGQIREIFIHRYRLIYKINDEEVVILSFVHGAQQYTN